MEDEILRAALAPSAECLSIDQLGRYADGALGPEERTTAVLHIGQCLNCQAELALLQAVTSSSVPGAEVDIVREPRREESTAESLFRRGPLAVAAVVLVGVGSLYLLTTGKAPELPRGVSIENEVTRSLAVSVRGPVGDQLELPRRFEWVAVEGAVRYRVRLMEVDRHELWDDSTTALAVDLPPPLRASIVPARTLIWEVTGYDAAGTAIAESGPQSFRLVVR